jgi:hypothetical protein
MSTLRGHAATMAAYDGHKGPVTIAAVEAHIAPYPELRDRLTGHELGLVLSACNRAYHAGVAAGTPPGISRADDCLYIDAIKGLVPMAALAEIEIIKGADSHLYTLNYTEPF